MKTSRFFPMILLIFGFSPISAQEPARCGIEPYNPATHMCAYGAVVTKPSCGAELYDPSTHMCIYGAVVAKPSCGAELYNPAAQTCENGVVKPSAGPQAAPAAAPPVSPVQAAPAAVANVPRAPNACADQLASKKDLDLVGFLTKLPLTFAEIKVKCKTSFTCPKDDKMTDLGMSVGCVKKLPEDPQQLAASGIDIAKGILAVKLGINENEIPSDLPGLKEFILKQGVSLAGDSSGDGKIDSGIEDEGKSYKSTVIGLLVAGAGVGLVAYGFSNNAKMKEFEDSYRNSYGQAAKDNYSEWDSKRFRRNLGYGIGGALLATGLGIIIFF